MEPGALIADRYEVQCLIGEGAVGAVYLAKHKAMDLQVAIKVLHQEHAERVSLNRRFEREAKMASSLDHPNIVRVTDFGRTEDGALYMVSEFVNGRTLSERLKHGQMSLERSLDVLDQVLDALEYAHGKGVLHRDIKPANIMLVEREGKLQVKLLDFGLARPVDTESTEETALTREGAILGTPLYMSPEQGLGDALDARTDIYSVGILLFQLLEGAPPFVRSGVAEVIRAHITEPLPEITFEAPKAQRDALERVLHKALAKKPEDRFENTSVFRQAVADCAERPEEVSRSLPRPPKEGAGRALKVGGALAAVVVLALIGAFALAPFVRSGGRRRPGSVAGASLAKGHKLLETDFAQARRIYAQVIKEEPWAAEDPEFLKQVSRLVEGEAQRIIRTVDRNAGKYANAACKVFFERRVSSRKTKQDAYECLYKHDGLTPDSLAWIELELGEQANRACDKRQWYAQQLARRPEPKARALLESQLQRTDSACFVEQIRVMLRNP